MTCLIRPPIWTTFVIVTTCLESQPKGFEPRNLFITLTTRIDMRSCVDENIEESLKGVEDASKDNDTEWDGFP